mmetsp:Transcript_71904/g.203046  ORF Transcript_71904/g.203046 Transcript_71904/m.203046 type:complete len:333 (-) Transcript_71904:55-1053(-)
MGGPAPRYLQRAEQQEEHDSDEYLAGHLPRRGRGLPPGGRDPAGRAPEAEAGRDPPRGCPEGLRREEEPEFRDAPPLLAVLGTPRGRHPKRGLGRRRPARSCRDRRRRRGHPRVLPRRHQRAADHAHDQSSDGELAGEAPALRLGCQHAREGLRVHGERPRVREGLHEPRTQGLLGFPGPQPVHDLQRPHLPAAAAQQGGEEHRARGERRPEPERLRPVQRPLRPRPRLARQHRRRGVPGRGRLPHARFPFGPRGGRRRHVAQGGAPGAVGRARSASGAQSCREAATVRVAVAVPLAAGGALRRVACLHCFSRACAIVLVHTTTCAAFACFF